MLVVLPRLLDAKYSKVLSANNTVTYSQFTIKVCLSFAETGRLSRFHFHFYPKNEYFLL